MPTESNHISEGVRDGESAYIKDIAERMSGCRRKCELGELIAAEIKKYSRYDLQIISARVRREVDILPEPYRSKFRPYSEIWFFGRYHKLLLLSSEKAFACGDADAPGASGNRDGQYNSQYESQFNREITDIETFKKFCAVIHEGCLRDDGQDEEAEILRRLPKHNLFYYLLNAFAMFVMDEPGHPVGTPFPGGMTVTQTQGGYLCPIRDKEEEILYSICNFCPAKQDPKNL